MNIKRLMMVCMMTGVIAFLGTTGTVVAAEGININTASSEQLQSVKGIGEKTAAAIIAYRKSHGAFKAVADLTNVKGIGDKKLDKIDDDLTAE